eukprot:1158380-Pelagomonas_calceolata.AAC.4
MLHPAGGLDNGRRRAGVASSNRKGAGVAATGGVQQEGGRTDIRYRVSACLIELGGLRVQQSRPVEARMMNICSYFKERSSEILKPGHYTCRAGLLSYLTH